MTVAFSKIGITVVVMMVLAVVAFFMVNVELPTWSSTVSAAAVIAFAIPSFWAAKMWLGRRDASLIFAVLAIYALLIETAAVLTGIPYGHFGYSGHLGYKIFGLVPWTVAFAWPPLMLGAYTVAAILAGSRSVRMILCSLLLVAFDIVLDPGAVLLGFWKYADGGFFYGVPISNFAGWLVSGFLGAGVVELLIAYFKPLLPVPVQTGSSAFLILFFWSCIAAFGGMLAPAVVGAALLFALATFWFRYRYSFDDMIVMVDNDNNPVGTSRKLEAHNSETRLHRAFSVFVFNSRGELLLQQRAFGKKTWPGVWSNSCCGHVMLHESTESAAKRRLKHELGLSGLDLALALPNFKYRAEKDGVVENELCPVLVGMSDREPVLNASEVASIRWLPWNEFLDSVNKSDTDISPWAVDEAQLLAESEVFKTWFARQIPVSKTRHAAVC